MKINHQKVMKISVIGMVWKVIGHKPVTRLNIGKSIPSLHKSKEKRNWNKLCVSNNLENPMSYLHIPNGVNMTHLDVYNLFEDVDGKLIIWLVMEMFIPINYSLLLYFCNVISFFFFFFFATVFFFLCLK